MDELKKQYELIREKGQIVDMDGFPIEGGQGLDGGRHNPDAAAGRERGLHAAERRAKVGRLMGSAGGQRLGGVGGGSDGSWHGLGPKEAAARAAERRAADSALGLGEDELSFVGDGDGDDGEGDDV